MANNPNHMANLMPPWTAESPQRGGGRTVGVRDKISRQFLEAMAKDFEAHKDDAMAMWRENHLDGYMRGVMSLLPKEATLNVNTGTALDGLDADQLTGLAAGLEQLIALVGQGAGTPEDRTFEAEFTVEPD